MYGYIYESYNTFTNEFYIGQKKSSKFIESYLGSGKKQKESINKYGKDVFAVSLLESAESQSELDKLEQQYILKYKENYGSSCINQAQGGKNIGNIYQYADENTKEEFKRKMTNINKTRCNTESFKSKCSENMNKRYDSISERKLQSIRLKATYQSHPEFGQRRSEALKEYYSHNEIAESIIYANQKKCSLTLNGKNISFDSLGDLKDYLKEEYQFVPDNRTITKLIESGDEYIPFRKSEKFQKLSGMKIFAQDRNSKLDKV